MLISRHNGDHSVMESKEAQSSNTKFVRPSFRFMFLCDKSDTPGPIGVQAQITQLRN